MADIDRIQLAAAAQLIGPSDADRAYWRQQAIEAYWRGYGDRARDDGSLPPNQWLQMPRPGRAHVLQLAILYDNDIAEIAAQLSEGEGQPVGWSVRAALAVTCDSADDVEWGRDMDAAERERVLDAARHNAEAAHAEWKRAAHAATNGIPHAELEQRRYGPGGRERYGDPQPGDFPGRASKVSAA
jgi:hypothetical protein